MAENRYFPARWWTPEKKGGTKTAKYRNKKVKIDNIEFDSTAEGYRYLEYRQLLIDGKIKGLELQKQYDLEVNGELICKYLADFVITNHDGTIVVIDEKGMRTKDYIIKKKLMKAIHGIEIKETNYWSSKYPGPVPNKPRKGSKQGKNIPLK